MNDDKPQRGRAVRVGDSWDWQQEWQIRRGGGSGVPLFGIFLILLGIFLIFAQYAHIAAIAGALFFLALGLIVLGIWVRDRGHVALYIGTFITALALSDLLTGAGVVHGGGWGTLFLGIGFLIIAGIRAAGGAGWGWQLLLGALLTFAGGGSVASSALGFNSDALTGPLLIVLLGVLIITRGSRASRPPRF